MIQSTSFEAWKNYRGKIGKKQFLVWKAFQKYGSCTNLEISHLTGIPINQITPRTNELVKSGTLIEDEKRNCNVSGRKAISWKTLKYPIRFSTSFQE